jgi:hypothetical protein
MENKIDTSFKKTIVSDDALSLAKDYSEIALDALFEDGTIKEIPIIGTAISLFKIGSSLRDRHLLKKIVNFLNSLKDVPKEKREEFLKKIDSDDNFKENVFEKVMLILDRLDETSKAELIGNLFKLYIMGVFDKQKFLRFAGMAERLIYYDLMALHYRNSHFNRDWDGDQPYYVDHAATSSLTSMGLMEQKIIEVPSESARGRGIQGVSEPALTFKITPLGQELANYLIYDLNDRDFQDHINRKINRIN